MHDERRFDWITPKVIRDTKAFWEPRYGRELSDQEAWEIARNLDGFFRILARWASEDRKKKGEKSEEEVEPTSPLTGAP